MLRASWKKCLKRMTRSSAKTSKRSAESVAQLVPQQRPRKMSRLGRQGSRPQLPIMHTAQKCPPQRFTYLNLAQPVSPTSKEVYLNIPQCCWTITNIPSVQGNPTLGNPKQTYLSGGNRKWTKTKPSAENLAVAWRRTSSLQQSVQCHL